MWAATYLNECICNTRDLASFGLGLISIIAWALAVVPQVRPRALLNSPVRRTPRYTLRHAAPPPPPSSRSRRPHRVEWGWRAPRAPRVCWLVNGLSLLIHSTRAVDHPHQ